MPDISNPHDRFFKESFSRPDVARDFFRHYLPAQLVEQLDLKTAKPMKGSFIDKRLRAHHSDLLYSVKLRSSGAIYIYILFEHKSSPEPFVALQLLRYMVRIWERTKGNRQKLTFVYPIVVYHGLQKWRVSQQFRDLFELPQAFDDLLPDFRYQLADLSRLEDSQLKGEILLRVGLLMLKYIFTDELPKRLPEIFSLLNQLAEKQRGIEYLETLLRYAASGSDKLNPTDIEKAITVTFQEGGELMQTLAQQWIEEGKQEGKIEGRKEGIREGLIAAIELGLELKFGEEALQLMTEISTIDTIETLQKIKAAIKTATSPEQLRDFF